MTEEIEKEAEELTQEYFQRFGGITCNWDNVNKIIQERLERESCLLKDNEELKAQIKNLRLLLSRLWQF